MVTQVERMETPSGESVCVIRQCKDVCRAFRNHKQVDPLDLPGSADLTADVDFSFLKSQVGTCMMMYFVCSTWYLGI